jgi:hypothetical protein
MKTGLVCAIVVAVLLLSSLLYWNTRPTQGPAPASQSQTVAAAPDSPVVLSEDPAGPQETARSSEALPVVGSPALVGDMAAAVPASLPASDEAKGFQGKYAGMNAAARQDALTALQGLLDGKGAGGTGQGSALTDEQSQEIKLEIEWLRQNRSP